MTALREVSPAAGLLGDLESLRRTVVRQERLARKLVLLGEVPVSYLATEVERLESELVKEHCATFSTLLEKQLREGAERDVRRRRLMREHVAFGGACAELRSLFQLVREDGHGGNRQALGQFWRLLAESILRHLDDEREWLDA